MFKDKIKQILQQVSEHKIPIEKALDDLKSLPYEDLGFANIDHHRALRKSFPEVVFCQGKTVAQVVKIILKLASYGNVLATRATPQMYEATKKQLPECQYNELGKTIVIKKEDIKAKSEGIILIATAGTSDMPVAEEAAVTAEIMGNKIERLYDVGVAGIHRLFGNRDKIEAANVIVVVAGMDGALPSVISGLVDKPVIAVPTSVGYGASFQGIAPLLTMLNACAPGITVVNIDNGFGAGYFASLVNK